MLRFIRPWNTNHFVFSYIRDLIETNLIQVIQCSTTDMIADPLTKPIGPVDLRRKTRDILGRHQPSRPPLTSPQAIPTTITTTRVMMITTTKPSSNAQVGVAAPRRRTTLPTVATGIVSKNTKFHPHLPCHGPI